MNLFLCIWYTIAFLCFQGNEDEFVGPTPTPRISIDDDSGKEDVPKPTKRRKKDGNERPPYWKFFDKRMIVDDDGVERKYAQCSFVNLY